MTELYRRYKALAIAAGAALLLDAPSDKLVLAVDELARDARGTGCGDAAAKLQRLVRDGATDERLDAVQASHRALRRDVWTTEACEYVPCCAGGSHHDH